MKQITFHLSQQTADYQQTAGFNPLQQWAKAALSNNVRIITLILMLCLTLFAAGLSLAQDEVAPARAIALRVGEEGTQVAALPLPGETQIVDFNPLNANVRARVDGLGMLRFNTFNSGEGVYSFSPYFDGFSTPTLEDNPLRVVEVQWSGDGQMLAFRIDSDAPAANDGVWFWQPARELPTDPSYHLLRDCPPGCNLVQGGNVEEWQSLSMEWSPDNFNILVQLYLPEEERRGFTVVAAARDPQTNQSRIGPNVQFYDYASWSASGENIIVSGYGSDEVAVFGSIARDGSSTFITPASAIEMAWVGYAVHQSDTGLIVMLASPVDDESPAQLVDSNGTVLTDFIGDAAPDHVQWSPDRTAVLVVVGDNSYVASVDGTIIDITRAVGDTQAIDWVTDELPDDTTLLPVTVVSTGIEAEVTEEPPVELGVGSLAQIVVGNVNVYSEPLRTSTVLGTLGLGEAVVIIGGPLTDNATMWWRVQSINFTGWIVGELEGVPTLGPASEPTG